jgi:hypothetical protein
LIFLVKFTEIPTILVVAWISLEPPFWSWRTQVYLVLDVSSRVKFQVRSSHVILRLDLIRQLPGPAWRLHYVFLCFSVVGGNTNLQRSTRHRNLSNRIPPWYFRQYANGVDLNPLQSALFHFQSLLLVILLLVCTCTYVRALFPSLVDRNKTGCLHFLLPN